MITRRVTIVLALVAAVLLASCGRAPSPSSVRPTGPWSGRCVGVADGDTISVMYEGREVRVRLNAVDCPEKTQAFGSLARRFTSDMVFGKTVTVHPVGTDRYGRTVGDVLTADGRSLNQALVEAGLAWWYRQYAPEDRRLQALETEARKGRRGLWRDESPLPPWELRRVRR